MFGEGPKVPEETLNQIRAFYEEHLSSMFLSIVKNFLPLTQYEVEMWESDPVEFFVKSREDESESMTRDEATQFIMAAKLRFPLQTRTFYE